MDADAVEGVGEAIGKASRELASLPGAKALQRLTSKHSLDEQAAQNLLTFLNDQLAATGAVMELPPVS